MISEAEIAEVMVWCSSNAVRLLRAKLAGDVWALDVLVKHRAALSTQTERAFYDLKQSVDAFRVQQAISFARVFGS